MSAADILQAIEELPYLDRGRIYQAILHDSSVGELTAELRTVDPGDDGWDDLVWFAKTILALDNDSQKDALETEAPPVCEAGGAVQPNQGREPDGNTNPSTSQSQAGPG